MPWGQVEAPRSRAAWPPQPAVLQAGAEGCRGQGLLQCLSLQPAQCCCTQIRSRNAAGWIREPLVPSAEQLPAGEHLHQAPANCKRRIAAPLPPVPAPLNLYPEPCTLLHCTSILQHPCTCILQS